MTSLQIAKNHPIAGNQQILKILRLCKVRPCAAQNYLALALVLLAPTANAQWLSEERELMGTSITIELWSDGKAADAALIETVFAEIQRLDLMINP